MGWGSGHRPKRATRPGSWGSCPSEEPQNGREIGSQWHRGSRTALSLLSGPQPVLALMCGGPAPGVPSQVEFGSGLASLFPMVPGDCACFSVTWPAGAGWAARGPAPEPWSCCTSGIRQGRGLQRALMGSEGHGLGFRLRTGPSQEHPELWGIGPPGPRSGTSVSAFLLALLSCLGRPFCVTVLVWQTPW